MTYPESTTAQWLPDPQHYAVQQFAENHGQALYSFGEYTLYFLMWKIEDYEAGLVLRCPKCVSNPVFDSYSQPEDQNCTNCFGTTFDGYKARLVRPTIWVFGEVDHALGTRGESVSNTAHVQTPEDFRLRTGDYIIKADNTRWQVKNNAPQRITTGFDVTDREPQMVGYSYDQVTLEDESSVAYRLPPTDAASVRTLLDVSYARTPQDFVANEIINGPLL